MKYYIVAFALGIGLGYFLMPKKEVVKVVEVQVDRVVTIIKRPDGTEERVEVDKSKTISEVNEKVGSQAEGLAVSGLVGFDFKGGQYYGAHASKPLLGPISVGAFGLVGPSVVVGGSLGYNF